VQAFFLDSDLKTMFSMFDITGRGTITIDQCNAAMGTLMGICTQCSLNVP
jgi:hypothetical protein